MLCSKFQPADHICLWLFRVWVAMVLCCNFTLLMMPILTSSPIITILGHLDCMLCPLFKPVHMFIFILTDGKCSLYVYHAKVSLLEQTKHVISLHTIQNVVSLSTSFVSLTYDVAYLSLSSTSPTIFTWSLVFYVFISGVYLTFGKSCYSYVEASHFVTNLK